MRIALSGSKILCRVLGLLGLLIGLPVWAAAAPPDTGKPSAARTPQARQAPAAPRAKTAAPHRALPARHAGARPTTTRPSTTRPSTVRVNTHGAHYAHGVESRHPGLGEPADEGATPQIVHFPAAAAASAMPQVLHGIDGGYCGQMLMPAMALREVSRGFRHGHAGIDLMAPHGSPIRAAAAGSVIYAGWYYAYGNIVDLRHADGVVTRYAHMSVFAPQIAAGTQVAAGEEIGNVGATGRATGAHVHFEVRLHGRAVDPRPYLALSSCDSPAGGPEILEAYADERPTVAARRPAARASDSRPVASRPSTARPPTARLTAGRPAPARAAASRPVVSGTHQASRPQPHSPLIP